MHTYIHVYEIFDPLLTHYSKLSLGIPYPCNKCYFNAYEVRYSKLYHI